MSLGPMEKPVRPEHRLMQEGGRAEAVEVGKASLGMPLQRIEAGSWRPGSHWGLRGGGGDYAETHAGS